MKKNGSTYDLFQNLGNMEKYFDRPLTIRPPLNQRRIVQHHITYDK